MAMWIGFAILTFGAWALRQRECPHKWERDRFDSERCRLCGDVRISATCPPWRGI